jgi:hypothetical protein
MPRGESGVAFRARAFSELFARPQSDRVVVRAGLAIAAELPEYDSLDAASSLAPPRGFGAPNSSGETSVGFSIVSPLMKQNKKGKICFVIYFAGFFFLNFFCYEVFAKQKKAKLCSNHY